MQIDGNSPDIKHLCKSLSRFTAWGTAYISVLSALTKTILLFFIYYHGI